VKARTLAESFRFAFEGVRQALRTERNLRIHTAAAAAVLALAFWLRVPAPGVALLVLAIGLVITAELFNTALEAAVDLSSPAYHPLAAVAKNVAAAAVLTAAAVSVAVGYIVFRDYLPPATAAAVGAGLALTPRALPGGHRTRRVTDVTNDGTEQKIDIDVEQLLEEARAVRERAYVPYSRFKVGAALLTKSGRVFAGCNFENASLGATICAERAAAGAAISAGQREWVALAVVADYPEPVPPCGICRQVLAEFAPDMPVVMANLAGERRTLTVRELLPGVFSLPGGGDG